MNPTQWLPQEDPIFQKLIHDIGKRTEELKDGDKVEVKLSPRQLWCSQQLYYLMAGKMEGSSLRSLQT